MRILIIVITLFLSTVHASAQTAQEWRDSLSYLSQLIERNPKSLELRMRKAEANIALEQWQYAMDEYSNILDLYPTHLGAFYFRAFTNVKLRRYAFARLDYEQVLKYAPEHEGALTGLVRAAPALAPRRLAQSCQTTGAGVPRPRGRWLATAWPPCSSVRRAP